MYDTIQVLMKAVTGYLKAEGKAKQVAVLFGDLLFLNSCSAASALSEVIEFGPPDFSDALNVYFGNAG